MKKLLAVNILYVFVTASLSVLVPLYLIEKQIDIATIGLLLSLGPLMFMTVRLFFASMADEIGTKAIGIFYSVCNLLAICLYVLVPSSIGLAAANLTEGLRNSGFWGIIRTETLDEGSRAGAGSRMVLFSTLRQFADGAGRLSVGVILVYLAFQGAFVLFFALSLLLFTLVLSFEKNNTQPGSHIGISMTKRIFKPRPMTFWHASFLQMLFWLAYNALLTFLLPIYLVSSLGFSYLETAGMVALLSLAMAVSSLVSIRWRFNNQKLLLLTLLIVPALLAIPFVGNNIIVPLVLISVGIGSGSMVAEYILVDQVFRSKDPSTDIGVLYTPLKTSEFLFLSLGGFVISRFGFAPLFFVCAISVLLFVILSLREMRLMRS